MSYSQQGPAVLPKYTPPVNCPESISRHQIQPGFLSLHFLGSCCSRCGLESWRQASAPVWELVRNSASEVPAQIFQTPCAAGLKATALHQGCQLPFHPGPPEDMAMKSGAALLLVECTSCFISGFTSGSSLAHMHIQAVNQRQLY